MGSSIQHYCKHETTTPLFMVIYLMYFLNLFVRYQILLILILIYQHNILYFFLPCLQYQIIMTARSFHNFEVLFNPSMHVSNFLCLLLNFTVIMSSYPVRMIPLHLIYKFQTSSDQFVLSTTIRTSIISLLTYLLPGQKQNTCLQLMLLMSLISKSNSLKY